MTSTTTTNRPVDQIDFNAIRADVATNHPHHTPPARHALGDVIAHGLRRGMAFWQAAFGRFV